MQRSCVSVEVEASAVGKILTILTAAIEQGVPCTISSVKPLKSAKPNTTKTSTKKESNDNPSSRSILRFKRSETKVEFPETKLCRSTNAAAPVPMDASPDGKFSDVVEVEAEVDPESDVCTESDVEWLEEGSSGDDSEGDDCEDHIVAQPGSASTNV